MICSHCETEIEQNYCPKCGQKWLGKPTTIVGMFLEIIEVQFSLERSVFATFLKLLSKPKDVIVNFSNGFRRFYASPGKVIFYSLTFLALHLAFVNENILSLSFVINDTTEYAHLGFLVFFGFLMFLVSAIYFRLKDKTPWSKTLVASLYLLPFLLLLCQIIQNLTLLFSIEYSMQVPYFILVFLYLSIALTKGNSIKWYFLNFIFQTIIFVGLLLAIIGLILYFNPDNQTKFTL